MRALLILIPLAALAACSDPGRSLAGRDAFVALGHAPAWSLIMEGRRLKFVSGTPETLIEIPSPPLEPKAGGRRYASAAITVDIEGGPCLDSRSGVAFAHRVAVTVGPDTYRGCGGEREPMLDR